MAGWPPYVEGEALRERLDRETQLPVDEAVALASDVAEALQTAHEQAVVPRDVKPANIRRGFARSTLNGSPGRVPFPPAGTCSARTAGSPAPPRSRLRPGLMAVKGLEITGLERDEFLVGYVVTDRFSS